MTDFSRAREAMVDCQVRPSDVTSFPIIEAMLWAPRERFVPAAKRGVAYAEAPIDLGGGREALEPRTLAKMLDGARIDPDDMVLDVAPGLGYSTALIARMAAAVIAVEPDEAMAAAAAATLTDIDVDNAVVTPGDAAAGDADHAPYDVIFVGGGVAARPDALLSQLKDGGRLVAILQDGGAGRAVVWTRAGDAFNARRLFDTTAPVLPGFEREAEFAL